MKRARERSFPKKRKREKRAAAKFVPARSDAPKRIVNRLDLLPMDVIGCIAEYTSFDNRMTGRLYFLLALLPDADSQEEVSKNPHAIRAAEQLRRVINATPISGNPFESGVSNWCEGMLFSERLMLRMQISDLFAIVRARIVTDSKLTCRFCVLPLYVPGPAGDARIFETSETLHTKRRWKNLIKPIFSLSQPAHQLCWFMEIAGSPGHGLLLSKSDSIVPSRYQEFPMLTRNPPPFVDNDSHYLRAKNFLWENWDFVRRSAPAVRDGTALGRFTYVCRKADYERCLSAVILSLRTYDASVGAWSAENTCSLIGQLAREDSLLVTFGHYLQMQKLALKSNAGKTQPSPDDYIGDEERRKRTANAIYFSSIPFYGHTSAWDPPPEMRVHCDSLTMRQLCLYERAASARIFLDELSQPMAIAPFVEALAARLVRHGNLSSEEMADVNRRPLRIAVDYGAKVQGILMGLLWKCMDRRDIRFKLFDRFGDGAERSGPTLWTERFKSKVNRLRLDGLKDPKDHSRLHLPPSAPYDSSDIDEDCAAESNHDRD